MTDTDPNKVNHENLTKFTQEFKNSKLFLKIHSYPNKKRLLFLSIIAISLPLTLILASQQQIFEKQAAELTEISSLPYVEEDNIPEDVVPFTDPQIAQNEFDQSIENLNAIESPSTTNQKPNIVIIMLDDVNPVDGRLWKREFMPATYDNIISKGINFTNFYGETSLCCPGRVGFLTGQHTQNHGVGDLNGTKFHPGTTIATELQSKGYFTMLAGKYINFFAEIPQNRAIPPGWNKFDAVYGNQTKYYNYNLISKKAGFNNTESTISHHGSSPSDYLTDVITRTALKRLKEAPPDKPIFAYLAPYAIHTPRTIAPRYENSTRCSGIEAWKTPNVWETDVSDKSDYFNDLENANPANGYGLTRNCKVLLAVDDLIRNVKNELNRQGRLNNTIFILTADNGYGFGEHRIPAKTSPFTTHIPFYVSWPAGRGTAPKTDSNVLSNIDLASTLCEVAGCVMGPYPNGQKVSDGISFLSLIKNQTKNYTRYSILESQYIKPKGTIAFDKPTWWAIRTTEQHPLGRWHYVEYSTGEKELYDLSNEPCYLWTPDKGGDPCELNNLLRKDQAPSPQSQNIATQLKAELELLKTEKGFRSIIPTVSPTPTNTQIPTPTNSPENPSAILNKTFLPIDDAYVRKDSQSANYGSLDFIRIDGDPGAISYLKFDLRDLNGKSIQKAVLRFKVSSNSGANANLTKYPVNVKPTSNLWTEKTITFQNKPSLGSKINSITGINPQGAIAEVDITSGVNLGKINSFVLESTGGLDGIVFNSKEASTGKPRLEINYQ